MDDVGAAYAAVADRYIELFGRTSSVHADDVALIERHLGSGLGSGPVLDLGCGPGHLTAHLAARRVDAFGLDVVPAFVEHARASGGRFVRGSIRRLPVRDGAASGILAWYSLIHLSPADLDDVLVEMRRVAAPACALVVGCFDGAEVAEFAHRVAPAFTWPVDELADRLARAGFTEVERLQRPADPDTGASGARPHAAIAAVAG